MADYAEIIRKEELAPVIYTKEKNKHIILIVLSVN